MASTSTSASRFPGGKARTTSASTRRRRLSRAGHWMIRPSRQKGRSIRVSSAAAFPSAVATSHCRNQSRARTAGRLTTMLLAIDLGNTNLTFGLFEGDQLRHDWRLATRRDSMPDELGLVMVQLMRQEGFDPRSVDAVVVASVVPPLNSALVQAIDRYFGREPMVVGPGIKTGLKIHYRDPKEVGADRIVAAMAAFKKYGGPLIIIDFGTGTTYDVVSKEGDYLGGAIAPGMGISVDALYERAARLQRVELKAPPTVIGRTTAESMQAGIIFGFTAQVEGMVARIKKELGENPRVIATGGLAGLIAAETPVIELVDQRLMLEGLRMIHELNA